MRVRIVAIGLLPVASLVLLGDVLRFRPRRWRDAGRRRVPWVALFLSAWPVAIVRSGVLVAAWVVAFGVGLIYYLDDVRPRVVAAGENGDDGLRIYRKWVGVCPLHSHPIAAAIRTWSGYPPDSQRCWVCESQGDAGR